MYQYKRQSNQSVQALGNYQTQLYYFLLLTEQMGRKTTQIKKFQTLQK